jgi:hypothetical protein
LPAAATTPAPPLAAGGPPPPLSSPSLELYFLLPVLAGNGPQLQQEQLQSQSAITAYDNMLQDKERVIRE